MKTSIFLALLTSVALSVPAQAQTKRLSEHATAKSRNQGHSNPEKGTDAPKPSSSVSGGKADGDRIHIKDKSTFMNVDFARQKENGTSLTHDSKTSLFVAEFAHQKGDGAATSPNTLKSHITIVSQKQDAETRHTLWESASSTGSVRRHDTEWSKHGHTITSSSRDLEDKARVHDKYMSMGSPGPTIPEPDELRMHNKDVSEHSDEVKWDKDGMPYVPVTQQGGQSGAACAASHRKKKSKKQFGCPGFVRGESTAGGSSQSEATTKSHSRDLSHEYMQDDIREDLENFEIKPEAAGSRHRRKKSGYVPSPRLVKGGHNTALSKALQDGGTSVPKAHERNKSLSMAIEHGIEIRWKDGVPYPIAASNSGGNQSQNKAHRVDYSHYIAEEIGEPIKIGGRIYYPPVTGKPNTGKPHTGKPHTGLISVKKQDK